MIFKKIIFLSLVVTSIMFGQVEINKHIIGPSLGISFLGSVFQVGIDHEYLIPSEDIGLNDNGIIGVGGIIRIWNYDENYRNVKWEYNNILIGGQANYHFILTNGLIDPWIGVILAYNIRSSKFKILTDGYTVNSDQGDKLWLGINAGLRYWFRNNLAVGVRLGFGTFSYSMLDLNFTYKLK